MLGEPREEFEGFWTECQKLFPDWVGFREDRRTPTPKLMRIYRKGSVSLEKCLRDIEREIDKEEQEKLMYYVATAYRGAKRARHSYVIGVYSTFEKAEAAAEQHIHDRGFKYGYGIDACPLDEELEDDDENIVNPHGG